MVQWYRENMPYETIKTMTVRELRQLMMANEDVLVLDPRPHHEWTEAHLPEAEHIFVGELEKNLDRLPKDGLIASMCSVGFRGGMAAAILKRHGYENVVNVLGGTSAWIAAGYHVVRGDQ
jgi:hydroxyacylglutathione hydrolase